MDASERIAALERRLGDQQRELDETRAELARLSAGGPTPPKVTRRDWMRRAAILSGGTVAAGVTAGVAGAGRAAAADGDPIKAGQQTNEVNGTVLFVQGATTGHGAFTVTDTVFADLPPGTESGAVLGVAGSASTASAGVAGVGTSFGVYGLGEQYGVYGKASGQSSVGVGAQATGIRCIGTFANAVGAGSVGVEAGGETAISATGTKHGILAAGGSGNGVSASGSRGGRFRGTAAAINLAPAAHASHPVSGSAGDLVVDRHHRLWFCKGGRTWVRLA